MHQSPRTVGESPTEAFSARGEPATAGGSGALGVEQRLQSGDPRTVAVWKALVAASEQYFASVYERLGVKLTPADLRGESFYNDQLPAVVARLDREGLLKESDGAKVVYPEGFENRDGEPLPMLVQKGDGGYLYATTDLAADLYRAQSLEATRLIYVVGLPQRQHFDMLTSVLREAGWISSDVAFEFVGFGSVLGGDGKMLRTRAGEAVKLTDLIEEAQSRAQSIIRAKAPALPSEEAKAIGRALGIGALKYADLSSDRVKDYVFDWERMLSFEGNTAPYLVNAYVRIQSIFRKAELAADTCAGPIRVTEPSERALVLLLSRYGLTLGVVAQTLQPHHMATYLYELARAFHAFYERCPVFKEGVSVEQRASRLALCRLVARTLKAGLATLGIETVEKM